MVKPELRFILLLLLLLKDTMIAVLLFALVLTDATAKFLRPCYFTNWAQYRPGRALYTPEDYIPGLCTHILYAFASVNSDFTLKASDQNDLPGGSAGDGLYKRVNALKKQDSGLKTLLSIGGGAFSASVFKALSASSSTRNAFITSAIEFVRQYGFDGIDLDWEFPTGSDKMNYVLLIKELRAAVEAESQTSRLLITAAVSADQGTIQNGYDIKALAPYFDFVNLMTYDYHGSWSNEIGFNSPLYPRNNEAGYARTLNMDWSATYWVSQGMPKEKLVIGLATYARGWTLADTSKIKPGDLSIAPSNAGIYTGEAGVAAYYELCEMSGTRYFDTEQKGSFLVSGDQWFGYDEPDSITIKATYVKASGYGGAFFWTLDFDDFNGKCPNGGGKRYPLISALIDVLGGSGQKF